MLYFENQCVAPQITNLTPNTAYSFNWFNPITGKWLGNPQESSTDEDGMININQFPDGEKISTQDWSLKIKTGK